MTTNLAEFINLVLKKVMSLLISSFVMTTYTCCNKIFINRNREAATMTMIVVGHVYSEMTTKTLEDAQSKAILIKYLTLTQGGQYFSEFFFLIKVQLTRDDL